VAYSVGMNIHQFPFQKNFFLYFSQGGVTNYT
jgi:hypothetical protein